MDSTMIDLLEKKMDKEVSECWLWQGALNQAGRPIRVLEKKENGKRVVTTINVRKVIYEHYKGKSFGRIIVSSCLSNICCNPDHLIDGTKENRFWVYVDKRGEDECWNWVGHLISGYGRITDDAGDETAHRFSYRIHVGEIPDGLMVLHKCNNKRCVNPKHLYVGTHNDNMRDMAESNVMKGEKNPKTLLTKTEVLEIRQMIKERLVTYANIAKKYGVKRQTIKDIASGRTWSWLK